MKVTSHNRLARAVITMLKPLLRVLIRNELTHAEFAELARQAYVETAFQHFSIPGKKMTYSRVSVLTGLSRKEVHRLTELQNSGEVTSKTAPNRAQRVINGWLSDSEFLTTRNKPRVLPLHGDEGSFAALVARYSGDITLGAVLDELERTRLVESDANRRVKLLAEGFVPQVDELQRIDIMAMCTADMLHTAVHNIESDPDDARLQRQVVYDDVPECVVERFRDFSHDKTSALLQDLNTFLAKETRKATKSPTTGKRVGMGIYYFEKEDSSIRQPEKTNEKQKNQ